MFNWEELGNIHEQAGIGKATIKHSDLRGILSHMATLSHHPFMDFPRKKNIQLLGIPMTMETPFFQGMWDSTKDFLRGYARRTRE